MSPKSKFLALSLLCAAPLFADAEVPARWGDWPLWGDQRDGAYRNPVLPGDYSDLDCIRVGSDYYAISSTFQYSPGMVVLHSKDLVNWSILGHAINDVTEIGPELNWDRMDRYARGVWAGAIRHHEGKFWIYFGTPDEGYFMTTATNPAGPWAPLHRMTKEAGWDDCCPFWDDDGQGYFVGTHFKDGYKTYLYKLTPDGRDLVPESRVLINEGHHREANKLFKVGDTYYHFFSEYDGGGRYGCRCVPEGFGCHPRAIPPDRCRLQYASRHDECCRDAARAEVQPFEDRGEDRACRGLPRDRGRI